jgi:hypothetical protein
VDALADASPFTRIKNESKTYRRARNMRFVEHGSGTENAFARNSADEAIGRTSKKIKNIKLARMTNWNIISAKLDITSCFVFITVAETVVFVHAAVNYVP